MTAEQKQSTASEADLKNETKKMFQTELPSSKDWSLISKNTTDEKIRRFTLQKAFETATTYDDLISIANVAVEVKLPAEEKAEALGMLADRMSELLPQEERDTKRLLFIRQVRRGRGTLPENIDHYIKMDQELTEIKESIKDHENWLYWFDDSSRKHLDNNPSYIGSIPYTAFDIVFYDFITSEETQKKYNRTAEQWLKTAQTVRFGSDFFQNENGKVVKNMLDHALESDPKFSDFLTILEHFSDKEYGQIAADNLIQTASSNEDWISIYKSSSRYASRKLNSLESMCNKISFNELKRRDLNIDQCFDLFMYSIRFDERDMEEASQTKEIFQRLISLAKNVDDLKKIASDNDTWRPFTFSYYTKPPYNIVNPYRKAIKDAFRKYPNGEEELQRIKEYCPEPE